MRLRTLFAIATAIGAASIQFVGCGSDEEIPVVDADAGNDSPNVDTDTGTTADTGVGNTNPICKPAGQSCANSADCCTANCNATTKICDKPIGTCKAPAETCSFGSECCTYACVSGKCSDKLCVSDNKSCTTNQECCGGTCAAGICKPLNTSCRTSGNSCTTSGDCCSKLCSNGICSGQPSFCTQTGDGCQTDFECCGGKCNKAAGSTIGLCEVVAAPGAPGCLVTGQVCSGGTLGDGGVPTCGGECCSRACGPYGPTGAQICQPPSGCRPTGETCREGNDCCGFGGVKGTTGTGDCSIEPGAKLGRCDNGNACRPAGAICKLAVSSCNAENNCCAGNVNKNPFVCQQDLLGIPRCTIGGTSCADAGSKQGLACGSSADCCGLACVPNNSGANPAFICGGTCIPKGGSCSTSADCCPGIPCVQLPGSTKGVCGGEVQPDGGIGGGSSDAGALDAAPPGDAGCSFSGQICTTSAQCCNGLACTSGRCQTFIK